MKVERCNNCKKVREINFTRGEQPAQIVEMCKCKDRYEKMTELKLKTKKKIIKERTISKIVEEILENQDIKQFGTGGSHIIIPVRHKGKKAIIGVYEK